MRCRGRRLPPSHRHELGQRARAALEAVLRFAVHEDVQIAVLRVQDKELAIGIGLRVDRGQPQRMPGEPAEADVGEPGFLEFDDDGGVVQRRAEGAVRREDLGGVQPGVEAEFAQERGEQAVQLVAESAAAPVHDLVEERVFGQVDRLAEMHAEVLERDRGQVPLLQEAQSGNVR